MIWLLTNVWWLVPLALVALGCLHPAGWALLRSVPLKGWLTLAGACLLALTFQGGRWYERIQLKGAQEAAEGRADDKAARVAKGAGRKAQETRQALRKQTEEATNEAREIVAGLPATCPPMPDRLLDIGRDAVEGARGEVLPTP